MGKRGWPWPEQAEPNARAKIRAPPHIRALQDRTIDLLFEGANRKTHSSPAKNAENTKTDAGGCGDGKSMKQMCIGRDGTLVFNDIIETTADDKCAVCNVHMMKGQNDIVTPCSYCEIKQCSECVRICTVCTLATCHNCSITSYCDHIGILCLSCCR